MSRSLVMAGLLALVGCPVPPQEPESAVAPEAAPAPGPEEEAKPTAAGGPSIRIIRGDKVTEVPLPQEGVDARPTEVRLDADGQATVSKTDPEAVKARKACVEACERENMARAVPADVIRADCEAACDPDRPKGTLDGP